MMGSKTVITLLHVIVLYRSLTVKVQNRFGPRRYADQLRTLIKLKNAYFIVFGWVVPTSDSNGHDIHLVILVLVHEEEQRAEHVHFYDFMSDCLFFHRSDPLSPLR